MFDQIRFLRDLFDELLHIDTRARDDAGEREREDEEPPGVLPLLSEHRDR